MTIKPIKTIVLDDVYTPACPAKENFVNRAKLTKLIKKNLRMPGKQLVIYGHTGSGKTSILDHTLYEVYPNSIKSNCMSDSTFESIILDAFDQLEHTYIAEKVVSNKAQGRIDIGATIKVIRAQISGRYEKSQQTKEVRALPPQLTGSGLADLLGSAGLCWVIEDFHKVEPEHKIKLSQLMKVFMDKSKSFDKLKVIAVGAVNTARQVVQYDNEMTHRVAEIKVPLMSDIEIRELVLNGEELLKIQFDDEVVKEVIKYSNGVAAVAHDLCHAMCTYEGIDEVYHYDEMHTIDERQDYVEITMTHFNQAVLSYLEEQSDTMKSSFDKALTNQDADAILYAISQSSESGLSPKEVESVLKEHNIKYFTKNFESLATSLVDSQNGAVLRYEPDSNKYCFRDPFYHSFARMFFKQSENLPEKDSLSKRQRQDLFNSVFRVWIEELESSTSNVTDVTITDTASKRSEDEYIKQKLVINTKKKKSVNNDNDVDVGKVREEEKRLKQK